MAGALITIGLFTRPAAFLASGTMAVAYWMAHAPNSFFPVNNGGDAAILYCFVFLYLVYTPAGRVERGRPENENAPRRRRERECIGPAKHRSTTSAANATELRYLPSPVRQ